MWSGQKCEKQKQRVAQIHLRNLNMFPSNWNSQWLKKVWCKCSETPFPIEVSIHLVMTYKRHIVLSIIFATVENEEKLPEVTNWNVIKALKLCFYTTSKQNKFKQKLSLLKVQMAKVQMAAFNWNPCQGAPAEPPESRDRGPSRSSWSWSSPRRLACWTAWRGSQCEA